MTDIEWFGVAWIIEAKLLESYSAVIENSVLCMYAGITVSVASDYCAGMSSLLKDLGAPGTGPHHRKHNQHTDALQCPPPLPVVEYDRTRAFQVVHSSCYHHHNSLRPIEDHHHKYEHVDQ